MKKATAFLLFFLIGCSPVKFHQTSKELPALLKQAYVMKVSSDPKYLEGPLSELAMAKFSTIASIVPENYSSKPEEGGIISIKFSSRPSLSTDTDGRDPFMTDPDPSPRKRHIFQSSEMEISIFDANDEIAWKVTYRYEGRNDFKSSYIQKPEEAMEESLNRVFTILEKDLAVSSSKCNTLIIE